MNTVKRVERIFAALVKSDIKGADFKIAKSEFDLIQNDKQAISHLIGKNTSKIEWEEFRDSLVEYQGAYGLEWKRAKGPFTPIELINVELVSAIGEELAVKLHNDGVTDGNFRHLISVELPQMAQYLDKYSNDYSITVAKSAFSSMIVNSYRFKFTGRSLHFESGLEKYYYKDESPKKNENALGERIEGHILKELELQHIFHIQDERELSKYQNVDFEGLRIKKGYNQDEILFYNFELKTSNSIEYISDAISQGINYKEFSNYTYIIIPLFDTQNFYDPDRFNNFVKLAQDNEIGILSIDINPNTNEINGVNEIAMAPKRDIHSPKRLLSSLQKANKEFCPLCRKVTDTDNKNDCGWKVTFPAKSDTEDGESESCMKVEMEKKLILG